MLPTAPPTTLQISYKFRWKIENSGGGGFIQGQNWNTLTILRRGDESWL